MSPMTGISPGPRSAWQPLVPRRLSPAEAALRNAVIRHAPVLRLASAAGPLSLALLTAPAATDPAHRFQLASAGGRMTLRLDDAALARVGGDWAQALPDDLPDALRDAVAAACLAPLLTALREQLGLAASLHVPADGAADPAADPTDGIGVGLLLTDADGTVGGGLLRCDPAAARALATAIGARCPLPPGADPGRLPLAVALELARLRLPAADLRALAADDILLLPADAPIAAGRALLRYRDRGLALGHIDQCTFTIDRLLEATMTADDMGDALADPDGMAGQLPDDSAAAADDPEPGIPDPGGQGAGLPADLEVRLDFDVGALSLPLAELARLAPGYVIELDTPAGRPVRIRAGGRVIGYGELVQIDDRLGVQVSAVRLGDEP